MPFKKGTKWKPISKTCRLGKQRTTQNNQRKHRPPNKIREMLNKIEDPVEYINAITKLLPYAIGKKKTIEDIEETEPISILINIDGQEI